MEHGEWGRWKSRNLDFSDRTAQLYMKLHLFREEIKSANVALLTEAYNLIQGKAVNPDDIFDADDSPNVNGHWVVSSSSVDNITLPKKKVKGRMTKTVITPDNLSSLKADAFFTNNMGTFNKIVIKVPETMNSSASPEKYLLYGEFIFEATKLLKVGGKVIVHKRDK